jgi:hypothetical protein
MTPCAEHLDTDFGRERDAHRYEIVYVIRRAQYELTLSVPSAQGTDIHAASTLFHMHFRASHQEREVVLDLKTLEDFYESLSRLMEYVTIERLRA